MPTVRRTDRKMRLAAVAVCRAAVAVGHTGPVDAAVLGLAERLADGAAADIERVALFSAHDPTHRTDTAFADWLAAALLNWSGVQAMFHVLSRLGVGRWQEQPQVGRKTRVRFCEVISDIFASAAPPLFAPGWRTADAVALADAMYQSRDFGPLPVLADALEEAGCDDADILAHCRGGGPHARGCWVVDLVLGKS